LAVASSADLTLGQQVAKWLLDGTIGAVVSFVLSGIVGWAAGYPVSGLGIGAILGMAIVVALSYKAVTVAISGEESTQLRRLRTHPGMEGTANDAGLPFPPPRPTPLGWESRPTLFNESFRLVNLITAERVMSQTKIGDKTFYKCIIHGPAILIPSTQTWFAGKSEFFDEPQRSREHVV